MKNILLQSLQLLGIVCFNGLALYEAFVVLSNSQEITEEYIKWKGKKMGNKLISSCFLHSLKIHLVIIYSGKYCTNTVVAWNQTLEMMVNDRIFTGSRVTGKLN